MNHTLPRYRLSALVCLAVGAVLALSSCGKKNAEMPEDKTIAPVASPAPSGGSGAEPPAVDPPASVEGPGAETPVVPPASEPSASESPATDGGEPSASVGDSGAEPSVVVPPADTHEAYVQRLATLRADRMKTLRAVALADAALDSRTRALNEESEEVKAALAVVAEQEAAVKTAQAALDAAQAALQKAYAADKVWADFKAEADAAHKAASAIQSRAQIEIHNAHKKGLHLAPPKPASATEEPSASVGGSGAEPPLSSPAPAPESTPAE